MSTLSVDKVEPVGSTLTFGQSGDTFVIPAGAVFTNNGSSSGFAAGSTHAQQWRVTANFSGSYNPIITNWGAVIADTPLTNTTTPSTTAPFSGLGAPMAVSGSTGYWTFPVTGWWTVEFITSYLPMGNTTATTGGYINYAPDGTTFSAVTEPNGTHEASYRFNSQSTFLCKVEDTALDKVSLAFYSPTNATVYGAPTMNQTYENFIRIAGLI